MKLEQMYELRRSLMRSVALLDAQIAAEGGEVPELVLADEWVRCTEIAGIVRRRTDNVVRSLRRAGMNVRVINHKSYCKMTDAAVIFPSYKKYLKNKYFL